MPELNDGETAEIRGSAKDPYILKNTGGVYSCSCPAWRNQSIAIESRTCKHLRQYLGEEFEKARLGGENLPLRAAATRAKIKTNEDGSEAGCAEESGPGFLLAHSWTGDIELNGWWMSEKLDGVRAYWDGTQFISRQGNVYMAPDWFSEALPSDIHLDGELWLGRKGFQKAVSIVRRQDKNNDWKEIQYVVFDAPRIDDVFEARMAFIQQTLDELGSRYAQAHLHVRCKGEDHLREELARVEALGGEGLMLRQPGSKYEIGRSFSLLKVKTFHDADARVIEHLPGTGKHKGRMGALQVELADGTRFSVGTGFSDAEREKPPEIGSIITFRYQELSDRGVPRFPSYVRARKDVDSLSSSALPSAASKAAIKQAEKEAVSISSGTVKPEPVLAACTASAANTANASTAHTTNTNPASSLISSNKSQPNGADSSWRIFEFVEGSSSKFWQINTNGNDVTVRFGRIGTQGQEKTKSFADANAAMKYADEIVTEKTEKGYKEKS